MRTLYAPIALCLVLSACSTYASRGTSPTAFDGTYSGTVNQTHVAAASCPSTEPKPAKLAVENGMVVWSGSPTGTLYAPVAANGSFAASSAVPNSNNAVWFTGKITNHEMVARSNTGSCHTVYDLQKDAAPPT